MKRAVRGVVAGLLATAVLSGCGLLPGGGDEAADWAAMAQRIVEQAGSDDVVGVQLTAGGQLTMAVRAEGADAQWTTLAQDDEVTADSDGSVGDRAARPIKASEIDWTAIAAALPEGCQFGTVAVDWLPHGQVYQRTACEPGDEVQNPTIDGVPIPGSIEGHDQTAVQTAMEALEMIFPDGQVLEFNIPLDPGLSGYQMVGAKIDLADGSQAWLVAQYDNTGQGLIVGAQREDLFLSGAEGAGVPPALTFRASDYPAAAYVAAVEDGLAQVSWPPEMAVGLAASAVSQTELHYSVYRLLDPESGTGSITR